MAIMNGKWEMSDAGNMAEFMEKLGVPEEIRNKLKDNKPVLEINQVDNQVNIKTTTPNGTKEVNFKFGEEFETNSVDGKTIKCTVVEEGGKWVETQKGEEFDRTVTREVSGNEMTITLEAKGETCVVKYKRS